MQGRQLEIFRAEIMAPLAYAMSLVDGEQGNAAAFQLGQEAVGHQAFGGDIDHVQLAGAHLALDFDHLGEIQAGVQHGGAHAQLAQGRDLILHQGDQGRDHHADAVAAQGRQLITQGFSAAGGHQDQGVAAGNHVVDDLGLSAAKAIIAEDGFQDLQGLGHDRGF